MEGNIKNILIVGPTASGKSELAHLLGRKLGFRIISADSRQCYKYLDIGTAKPSNSYLSELEYKNISILNPKEPDNAKLFLNRFVHWQNQSNSSNIVVGGSTLYQQALLFGFDSVPDSNESNLLQLEDELNQNGIEYLFDRLKKVDPIYALKMDGFNKQRILRALDVFMQTGKPFSSYHSTNVTSKPKDWFVIYPTVSKEVLKERINSRVDQMISNGLLNEISTLLQMGFTFSDPGFNSIGYKEWEEYINQTQSLQETIQRIKTNSWQYAKRQLTWLKRWDFLNTYDISQGISNHNLQKILNDYSAFLSE